jgi:hypothetical protein
MDKHEKEPAYRAALVATGNRSYSMRGVLLGVLFEHFDEWLSAKEIAAIIRITPTLGSRSGDPCDEKHVMANMTLGIVQRRIWTRTSYAILVDPNNTIVRLTTKEKAKGVPTRVFDFSNFDKNLADPQRYLREGPIQPTNAQHAQTGTIQ